MVRAVILSSWFLLSLIFEIPSKASFLLGIAGLVVGGFGIFLNHIGFGLRLTTYSFGFFFVGLVAYLREVGGELKK